ncbi:hypothetical protein LbDm2_1053 [Levilactobacillus brevis]|nr:hypothetical protein LbDm2_1053 [Levilactobacillus brevis]
MVVRQFLSRVIYFSVFITRLTTNLVAPDDFSIINHGYKSNFY